MYPLINERTALEKQNDRLRDANRDRLRREARDAMKSPRSGRVNWLRAAVQLAPRRRSSQEA
jgi:hypothetical protein